MSADQVKRLINIWSVKLSQPLIEINQEWDVRIQTQIKI